MQPLTTWDPRIESLQRHWDLARKRRGALPSRVSLGSVPAAVAPHYYRSEVPADGRMRVVIAGPRLIDLVGRDPRVGPLDEVFPDRPEYGALLSFVIGSGEPFRHSGLSFASYNGRRIEMQNICLPLAEDGQTVDGACGVILAVPGAAG